LIHECKLLLLLDVTFLFLFFNSLNKMDYKIGSFSTGLSRPEEERKKEKDL